MTLETFFLLLAGYDKGFGSASWCTAAHHAALISCRATRHQWVRLPNTSQIQKIIIYYISYITIHTLPQLYFGESALSLSRWLCASHKLSANIRCKQALKVMCSVDTLWICAWSFLGPNNPWNKQCSNRDLALLHFLDYVLTLRSFIDCKAVR